MTAELHIRVHIDAEDVSDISNNFPYELGQALVGLSKELIVIDLGEAQDTTYVQDWYLNGHDGVASFYIVDDSLNNAQQDD